MRLNAGGGDRKKALDWIEQNVSLDEEDLYLLKMEKKMTPSFYAVIQADHAVMGIGTCKSEAIADAQEWGEIPDELPSRPAVSGECYVTPCTKELYEAVKAGGGQILYHHRDDGVADVGSI